MRPHLELKIAGGRRTLCIRAAIVLPNCGLQGDAPQVARLKPNVASMTQMPWEPEDFRLVIGSTRVDYDPIKEEINKKIHHYSLASAVHFLARLLLPVPQVPFITRDASTVEERRHEHMTVDDQGEVVFFVTTMRPGETVRVISLRRAHRTERDNFSALTGFKEKKHG